MNLLLRRLPVCLSACLAALTINPAAHAENASVFYMEGMLAYQQGNVEQAKKQFDAALGQDSKFRPATDMLTRISLQQGKVAPEALLGGTQRGTLDKLVFPVEFSNTALSAALEFIRQRAEQESGGKAQLNFVLTLPPDLAARKISLKLDHVPVLQVLNYIASVAGVSFQTQKYAILVVPATAAPSALAPDNAGLPPVMNN